MCVFLSSVCCVFWEFTDGFCFMGKESTLEICYHMIKWIYNLSDVDLIHLFLREITKTDIFECLLIGWVKSCEMMIYELLRCEYRIQTATKSSVMTFVCLCKSHSVELWWSECIMGIYDTLWDTFYTSCTLVSFNYFLFHVAVLLRKKQEEVTRETTVLVFVTSCIILFTLDLKRKKKNVFKSITNALFNSTMPFYFTRGV